MAPTGETLEEEIMLKASAPHVIILAGSEDTRLAPLTTALSGAPIPKQFAFIAGNGSLLQQTVAAYAPLIPPERISVVVPSAHEDVARTQLHEWPRTLILARPDDRGPTLDLLLALGRIVARAPEAPIFVAPAQHYVPGSAAMVGALAAASLSLSSTPVVLAGATIESLEQGSRFIVPGKRRNGRVREVAGMVGSTGLVQAERLRTAGGLWYTSAFTATASTLWRMAKRKLPDATRVVSDLWNEPRTPWAAIGEALGAAPDADYREELWEGSHNLGVVAVRGSGWNDWSSAERVMDSLRDGDELEWLLARIYRRQRELGASSVRRDRLGHSPSRASWRPGLPWQTSLQGPR